MAGRLPRGGRRVQHICGYPYVLRRLERNTSSAVGGGPEISGNGASSGSQPASKASNPDGRAAGGEVASSVAGNQAAPAAVSAT